MALDVLSELWLYIMFMSSVRERVGREGEDRRDKRQETGEDERVAWLTLPQP